VKSAGVVLLALGAASALGAQSLGEVAERERERRAKAVGRAGPRYGDEELARRRGDASAPSATATSPSPAASPGPSPTAPPVDEALARREKELAWRTRFAEARERVAREEAAAWRKVVEVVYVSGIPVQQWVSKFEETEGLRKARAAYEELEEEYRRTGLPPGWARP
jgi:hypothetical protein